MFKSVAKQFPCTSPFPQGPPSLLFSLSPVVVFLFAGGQARLQNRKKGQAQIDKSQLYSRLSCPTVARFLFFSTRSFFLAPVF